MAALEPAAPPRVQDLGAQQLVLVLAHGVEVLQAVKALLAVVAVAGTAQVKFQLVPETLKAWRWNSAGTQVPRVALVLTAVPFLVTAAQQYPPVQVSVATLLQVVVKLVGVIVPWRSLWKSWRKAEAAAKPRARRRVTLYIAWLV